MSRRTEKIDSLIQQVVAKALVEHGSRETVGVTVTKVVVTPDLRQATVWVGVLGDEQQQKVAYAAAQGILPEAQAELAAKLTTKFTPRLHLRHDTSGAYAQHIDEILRDL
jgi:ribosome-binding factor A